MFTLNSLFDRMIDKLIILLLFFVLQINDLYSQSMESLQKINAKSKDQYIKAESLDQLMIDLRVYENSPESSQDTLLLDTYKNISSGFVANNHFKQAYEVLNKFLARKENMLFVDKTNAISKAMNSVTERQHDNDIKQSDLQSKSRQLQTDIDKLEAKRLSFKGNFSLGLIILSSLFAIILVGAGIRMISLRSKLRQNQEKLKNLHRIAVIGNIEPGLRTSFKNSFASIAIQSQELLKNLKVLESNFTPAKKGVQIVSEMDEIIKEINSKF